MEILTAGEAAKILKVSKSKVYSMLRNGELPCVRMGKCVRVRKCDIERLITAEWLQKSSCAHCERKSLKSTKKAEKGGENWN